MDGGELPSSKCHFLHIPTEIRAEIFRYLLLPSPECHVLRQQDRPAGRAPAILRANRQIYSEASRILYSEGIVVLYPPELLHLCSVLNIGWPKPTLPTGDPLYGNSTSNLLPWDSQGAMPPYVFARFEKIDVMIDPSFLYGGPHSDISILIDRNFNMDADEIKNYIAGLEETTLFRDLVTVLSKSPVLKSVGLTVFVIVDWFLQDDEDEDEDASKEDMGDDTFLKDLPYMVKAFNTATDVLIGSGLLDPLRLLSNVEKFGVRGLDFPYNTDSTSGRIAYRRLGPKAARIVQDLKEAIEGNHHQVK